MCTNFFIGNKKLENVLTGIYQQECIMHLSRIIDSKNYMTC